MLCLLSNPMGRLLTQVTDNSTAAPSQFANAKRRAEDWPDLPLLSRRSVDRCDVFPVALGVEAIHLDRRGSMKLMFCAAIAAAHRIGARS